MSGPRGAEFSRSTRRRLIPKRAILYTSVLSLEGQLCHDSAMTNEAKDRPEGKFAEAMRKSKEKRQGMQQQSEKRAQVKEESIQREEASRADQAFSKIKDSEV
jgi:hypothetical protein